MQGKKIRKAKAQIEIQLARDTKRNKKKSISEEKDQGKHNSINKCRGQSNDG